MRGGQQYRIMSAVDAEVRGAYRHKVPHVITCRAWRVTESGAYELPIGEVDTIDDAVNAALSCGKTVAHKDTLLVHYADDGRRTGTLCGYAIKRKSQPRYVRTETGMKAEHDLYPAQLFVLPIYEFEPEKPFDAFTDDPTGLDRSIVEQDA